MKHVCVLGEGAWGTAVATLLASNGYTIKLWCHDPDVCHTIAATRRNECYLPGIALDAQIHPTGDLEETIQGTQWIFEAIPVKFLRPVLKRAQSFFSPEQIWVILSKGIEQDTLMLPSQILDDLFGSESHKVVLAGPSFAQDVARKQITAVTLAATDSTICQELQKMLANDYFRPYCSTDMIGAQVGAALKNVITLGIGMLDGAGFGDNTKAFLLTRGLHEMVHLARIMGGKQETLYGLSGLGDLVLTSMGQLSRNLAVGRRLGQGESLEVILRGTCAIPEGINTVKSVHQMIQQKNLDLPILEGIYQIIFGEKDLKSFMTHLVTRPLESEYDF